MKKLTFLFLLFWGVICPVSAQNSAVDFNSLSFFSPSDTKRYWTIGFSSLKAVDLSKENTYLSYSIPLLIRERISQVDNHSFSHEEIVEYKKLLLDDTVRRQTELLRKYRLEKDGLIFSSIKPSVRDAKLKDIFQKIDETLQEINYLKQLDLSVIDISDE